VRLEIAGTVEQVRQVGRVAQDGGRTDARGAKLTDSGIAVCLAELGAGAAARGPEGTGPSADLL